MTRSVIANSTKIIWLNWWHVVIGISPDKHWISGKIGSMAFVAFLLISIFIVPTGLQKPLLFEISLGKGIMRLSEDKIRRIAERIHDELQQRGLVSYKERRGIKPGEGRAARVKEIYEFIVADLKKEEEIDLEVERVLGTYSRDIKGTERDILYRKHKEEIARKRGYVL